MITLLDYSDSNDVSASDGELQERYLDNLATLTQKLDKVEKRQFKAELDLKDARSLIAEKNLLIKEYEKEIGEKDEIISELMADIEQLKEDGYFPDDAEVLQFGRPFRKLLIDGEQK